MSETVNENESNSNDNKESGNGKACTSGSEDPSDLHDNSDQRSEQGRRLATFSLSMSDCEESTYASDDARSNASTLDMEEEDEEPKESDRKMWMRQRELRLSLILGISADEKCEKQLAMHQDDDDGLLDFDRPYMQPAETSQEDQNSRSVETKGTANQFNTTYHEDREFDFLRSTNMRRCSSLKTNKTPPGTPHRKKAVRFADVLGLDLASVRHIINLDEPPIVPPSAMQDLDLRDKRDNRCGHPVLVQVRHLCTCFSQPGCSPDFLRRVQERKLSLETCVVEDKDLTVSGLIRVANIAYQKSVIVRHTVNGWMTYSDDAATYVSGSNDGATDRFSFTIHLPEYFGFGSRLEFSVMFSAGDQQFWDSNFGSNYRVECYFNMEPYSEGEPSAGNIFY